ncbi:RdRP-domain-containing protein [Bimuria novae-zelandiae CBS 107.79]|uniref:RNA-dependent RNA polymerase n=1 Tax=Bimuria novae-zelandiae CBS 107.79 TaxID=1447943 RepID=A0A6A5UT60_9PLEO|nr:RdRP-domain-containing protein [Bimuria novae-zelandiae CBS 107.79]
MPGPAAAALVGKAIDFGVTTSERTMQIMQTVRADEQIKVTVKVGDYKELEIYFPFKLDGRSQNTKFQLPLSLIESIYKVKDSLIIPFKSPPKFWIQNNLGKWYRQTDIVEKDTRTALASAPVMNHKETPVIDIGRWTTYRVTFDAATSSNVKYTRLKTTLADHGIHVTTIEDYRTIKGTAPEVWSLLEEEISGTHPHLQGSNLQESAFHDLVTGQINLAFDVRYQLEVCLSNGLLHEHNITRGFLERLASLSPAEAVYILEKVMEAKHECFDPMQIFNKPLKMTRVRRLPSYCILSRSANITPTLIHVGQPIIETSNRIVRKHIADADRFIRVRFSDEQTVGELFSQTDDSSDAIFNRITRAMTNGIVVAGRYYEFLAFGNSQFRERGAYFYAPTPSKSANDIRRSMGQFDHIKTAAKYGARLGQCFSTTRAIKSVNVNIEMIDDVKRNGYCFTDGVGKISTFLAQMAAKELGLPNAFHDPPSLYQFRLAGCKGVLALDPTISGHVVHIRPSQYKFEAQNVGLEIIRASALSVACFNRQLIIILSTLGVPDSVFIQKQQQMVNDLERATKQESVALEKLQRNIDLNQTTLTMAGMVIDGFMKSQEPFMMSLLQLWRAYHIKYLKEKARIVIEEGAYVLGCVDETASLKGHYNDPQSRPDATRAEKLETLPEIFLQISDTQTEKQGHYRVIEGICIIARNPSLHAGDVRVVRAVDVPTLHHLKNVVVLPQTGDRDISNMCSGGDLDGDDYIVLWDQDFLPETVNEPPMDFTAEKPTESAKPITVKDITDFFVTHMKNDSLGQIATAHLAQADFSAKGVRDPKCLELARLHSQAVDYSKSGIPAIMDAELRMRRRPHFQRKSHQPEHKYYKSKKILGRLFDQVQLVDFVPQYNKFDRTILDAYEPDETMLTKANELKLSYDSELKQLMAKHAIRTEFEAWSIFVLSHNLEARDYKFAEEFGRTIGMLKSRFRELCCEAAGAGRHGFEKLAPFVAAMYTVTAAEMEDAMRTRSMTPEEMPLMSFPWLFVEELGKIKTGQRDGRPDAFAPQQQNRPSKRHANPVPERELGGFETEQGITHFGEVLKLDFHHGQSNTHSVGEGVDQVGENAGGSHGGGDDETEAGWDNDQQQQVAIDLGSNDPAGTMLERLARLGN